MKTNKIKTILLSAFAMGIVAPAVAQSDGQWSSYPVYAGENRKVIEGNKKVFYHNSGVFSYDKESHESMSYTVDNGMTSNVASNIFYDPDKDICVAVYDNGIIDVIYSDGNVANIKDIALAALDSYTINDVIFDGNEMYVGASFGIVKFNIDRLEVIESGLFNRNVSALEILGDKIYANIGGVLYYLPKDKSISQLPNWTSTGFNLGNTLEMKAVGESALLVRGDMAGAAALRKLSINPETFSVASSTTLSTDPVQYLIDNPSGVYYVSQGKVYGFDDQANASAVADIPADYAGDFISSYDMDDFWTINYFGISNVAFSSDGGVTVLTDRFVAPAIYTEDITYIRPSKLEDTIYLYNCGTNVYRYGSNDLWKAVHGTRMNVRTGKIENPFGYPLEATGNNAKNQQKTRGMYLLNPTMITDAADEPGTLYLGTCLDGVHKIAADGSKVGYFNNSNSMMGSTNGGTAFGVHIDRGGNLLVLGYSSNFAVLPADKRRLPFDQISKTDWFRVNGEGWGGQNETQFLECEKSHYIFLASNNAYCFSVYDNNGTYTDFSDDKFYDFESITDQDGKKYNSMRNACFAEDNNGRVWFGTSNGIFVIDPKKSSDPDMTVTHVKVPRNDGTNEADYLLDGELVTGIAVDSRNRKWISSTAAGLTCVSPNGDEVLFNFNSSNSILPENAKCMSVWVDKKDDTVYVGTDKGLYKYSAALKTSAADFDNIYAYPNPVKPDYHGTIHITGLMDNSLVKIADSAGNVIAQGRAENGEYEWDGYSQQGTRVKTGVYFVFVSQNHNGTSAAVTKIMVIN